MAAEPEWREFEKLVAWIEEDLAPQGAVVTSPDRIPDLITGQLREVDASIRFQVGSSPILITVECRKRGSVQDDTWMEQLATKRAKIGADKTIAVSSSGFSEPARKTARLHGIELRTLEDRIGEEIVQRFLSGLKIEFIVTEYEAKTIVFELEDGTSLPEEDFGEELVAALAADNPHGLLATHIGTGHVVTADALLRNAMQGAAGKGEPSVVGSVQAAFKPHTVQVATKDGPKFLKGIEIVAEFRHRVVPAPATSLWEYASDEGPIRRTVKAAAPISEDEVLHLSADMDSPVLDHGGEEEASDER